jgi:nitrogen PTS system EIIA component
MRGASHHPRGRLFYNGPVVLRGLTHQTGPHGPGTGLRRQIQSLRQSGQLVGVWSIQATFSPANMNRLAKILPIENVVVGLSVTSKKRVFEQAGLIFENQNGIARSTVTDNLFARERLGSTGLGEGVAIPHGRIKGLKQPQAAFVRLAEPIAFEAPDGQPVSLLIFLLVPEQATQQHLEILSEIAQLLSDRETRERLHTEEDRETLHRLLTQWQP